MAGFVRKQQQARRWYVNTAASTSLTGTATETVVGSVTIPANTLRAGSIIRFKYNGRITATTSTTTLTIKAYLGTTTLAGTALISGTATTTAANLIYSGEMDIICRSNPSATASLVAHGLFCEPTAAGAVTPKQATMNATNFATNGNLLLEISAKWSAGDANATQLEMFVVEVLGPAVTTL